MTKEELEGVCEDVFEFARIKMSEYMGDPLTIDQINDAANACQLTLQHKLRGIQGEPPEILVIEKRPSSYRAHLRGRKDAWGQGLSEAQAVGDMILLQPTAQISLGLIIERKP